VGAAVGGVASAASGGGQGWRGGSVERRKDSWRGGWVGGGHHSEEENRVLARREEGVARLDDPCYNMHKITALNPIQLPKSEQHHNKATQQSKDDLRYIMPNCLVVLTALRTYST
jgi:hypothetical protein